MPTTITGTDGVSQVQTGAVESGDLAAGAINSGDLPAGSVIQVVSTTKTDTFSQTFSGNSTFSNDVTGLTATITPIYSSSLLVVFLNINVGSNVSDLDVTLFNNGSRVYIGDVDGSKGRTSTLRQKVNSSPGSSSEAGDTINIVAPIPANSTSSQTFSVRLRHLSSLAQTVYVNRVDSEADAGFSPRSASSITVMEIAQ